MQGEIGQVMITHIINFKLNGVILCVKHVFKWFILVFMWYIFQSHLKYRA